MSELEDTDSSASFQSHCHSCGVPWASHMGITGTCAENAKLRQERDEARRMYCDLVSKDIYHRTAGATCKNAANNLGWDCYKETP